MEAHSTRLTPAESSSVPFPPPNSSPKQRQSRSRSPRGSSDEFKQIQAILNICITLKKSAKRLGLSLNETTDQAKRCLREDPGFLSMYLLSITNQTNEFWHKCQVSKQFSSSSDAVLASSWDGIAKSMMDFSKSRIDEVCLCLYEPNGQAIALASKLLAVLSPLSEAECFAKVLGKINRPQDIKHFLGCLYDNASKPMQTLEELHDALCRMPLLKEALYELTRSLISLNESNIEARLNLLLKFIRTPVSTLFESLKIKDLASSLVKDCSGGQKLSIIREFSYKGIYSEEICEGMLAHLVREDDRESAFVLFKIMENMSSPDPLLSTGLCAFYESHPMLIREFMRKLLAEAKENEAKAMQTQKETSLRSAAIEDESFSESQSSLEEALVPRAKVHFSYKKNTNVLYLTDMRTTRTSRMRTQLTFLEGCSYVDIPDKAALFFTGGDHSNSANLLSVKNFNTSFPIAPMKGRRSWHGSVYFEGKVYVFGGKTSRSIYTDACECYDFISDTWTRLLPMPIFLRDVAPIGIEGKIYILGGRINEKEYSNKIFTYDLSLNVWGVLTCKLPVKVSSFPCFKSRKDSSLINFVQDSHLWTFCAQQNEVVNQNQKLDRVAGEAIGPCYVFASRLYCPHDNGPSSVVSL
jgi:hypothetical protein